MKPSSDTTLEYYENNAEGFIHDTLNKEMRQQYALFEKGLQKAAHILDAGCGSGRDALYFKEKGHRVTAFDASAKMSSFASKLLSQEVQTLRFDEMNYENLFDAIWASASLLHLRKNDMPAILESFAQALKPEGLFYASFKYGEEEYIKDGRFFNSYTRESFLKLIKKSPFECREIIKIEDTRPGKKGEFWLNALLQLS